MQPASGYLRATRHPWACLVFVLPLLIGYEVGVLSLGLEEPNVLRNGADAWLRWILGSLGFHHLIWTPSLLLAVLLIWHFCTWEKRPGDSVGLWIGMAVESVIFALMLWSCCHFLSPALRQLGVQVAGPAHPEPAMQQLLCFVGAGIYEETLFRLLLFSCLRWLLKFIDIPWPGATILAALVSAVMFSAAHNIGPYGEEFHSFVFTFRAAAGLYFVLLFRLRGFGIAVGAHAVYDVMAGLLAEFS
jgi:hypothetical protein